MSELGHRLTNKEISLYMSYYVKWGIGELGMYQRSGTEISTLINIASSFGGGESEDVLPEQIYPQLVTAEPTADDELIDGQLSGWNDMPEVKQQQMIDMGLCTPEGVYIKTST